jgi:hypothetical protein
MDAGCIAAAALSPRGYAPQSSTAPGNLPQMAMMLRDAFDENSGKLLSYTSPFAVQSAQAALEQMRSAVEAFIHVALGERTGTFYPDGDASMAD